MMSLPPSKEEEENNAALNRAYTYFRFWSCTNILLSTINIWFFVPFSFPFRVISTSITFVLGVFVGMLKPYTPLHRIFNKLALLMTLFLLIAVFFKQMTV